MFSKLDLCRSNPTLDSLSIYTCHTPLAFASLQNHFEHRFCPCFGTSSNRELHWSINPIGGRVFTFLCRYLRCTNGTFEKVSCRGSLRLTTFSRSLIGHAILPSSTSTDDQNEEGQYRSHIQADFAIITMSMMSWVIEQAHHRIRKVNLADHLAKGSLWL